MKFRERSRYKYKTSIEEISIGNYSCTRHLFATSTIF